MADTIPPVLIELQLETARISAQMAQMKGDFDNFGQTVTKQNTFMEKFKATAAGMFTGNLMAQGFNMVSGAIRGAIDDAQQYEKAVAQLNAGIKSTGNVAGLSVQGLKDQASALEKLSGIDENLIMQSQGVFQTFTNVRNVVGEGNDIFNQATLAAADLSTKMQGDLQGATVQLGKALNDPIKGITALTRVGVVFTDSQKAQIKALVESGDVMGAQKIILAEMKTEFGGAAAAAGDTFAGAVFRAKDKVQDFTRDLVTNLQPILLAIGKTIGELYSKFLAPLFSWLGKNKEAVALFVGIIGTAIAAFKLYQLTMAAVAAVQELYVVGMALARGAKLADIAATEGQTGAMVLLNAVMNANPIAIVVVALAALAAGFVIAWNHSETFRKVVITAFQGVLSGVSFAIRALAMFVDFAGKYLILPFKTLLGALSHLPGVGKYAKAALNFIDDLPGNINKAADAVDSFSAGLTKLQDKKISIPGFGGKKATDSTTPGGATAPTGSSAAAAKEAAALAKKNAKAIEAANKDVQKIYEKMNAAIDEGNKKAANALTKRDEAIVDTKKKYAAKELEIIKKKNEELAKNELEWNKAYIKAKEDAAKRNAKIDEDYAKKQLELHKVAQNKIEDAETKAAEKRASIIQASIDRLRSAFANGTAASITDIFKSGATSADAMIEQLKNKLAGARELQKNAAALQAAGYSQVFIEEVVKNGPEVGNQMAQALLSANTDTQAQLKDLYGQVNDISAHGLDEVAKTMNAGGKLATEELMKQFTEVTTDLNATIKDINANLLESLATANEDYKSKLADSKAALNEALTAADERLAEANAATMKDFNEAMQQNSKDLADALAKIQSDYEDTIAQIAQDTKEKLAALQKDLLATIKTLKDLGAAKAAAAAGANSPYLAYQSPTATPITSAEMTADIKASDDRLRARVVNYHYNVTGVNMTDPAATAKQIDNTVKFGAPQSIYTSQGLTNKLDVMGVL